MSDKKIVFLGPEGTFSHRAAQPLLSAGLKPLLGSSLQDVFKILLEDESHFAVLPIQNNTAGSIGLVYDLLIPSQLVLLADFGLNIEHALLSKEKKTEDLTEVFSHPEPYNQCQIFYQKHLSHCHWIQTSSSVSAMEACLESDRKSAAIGSKRAGEKLGLNILKEKMQDLKENTTRFVLLGRQGIEVPEYEKEIVSWRSTFVFTLEDRPGTLTEVLRKFEKHGLNMCHIESRPTRLKKWNYYFWVSLDVKKGGGEGLEKAREEVQSLTPWFRDLGVYPVLTEMLF